MPPYGEGRVLLLEHSRIPIRTPVVKTDGTAVRAWAKVRASAVHGYAGRRKSFEPSDTSDPDIAGITPEKARKPLRPFKRGGLQPGRPLQLNLNVDGREDR